MSEKRNSGLKLEIEDHRWIQQIRVKLNPKFQLQQTTLIFLTKFAQKEFFWTKKEKYEYNNQILNVRSHLGSKFHFKRAILNFWTQCGQKESCRITSLYFSTTGAKTCSFSERTLPEKISRFPSSTYICSLQAHFPTLTLKQKKIILKKVSYFFRKNYALKIFVLLEWSLIWPIILTLDSIWKIYYTCYNFYISGPLLIKRKIKNFWYSRVIAD